MNLTGYGYGENIADVEQTKNRSSKKQIPH